MHFLERLKLAECWREAAWRLAAAQASSTMRTLHRGCCGLHVQAQLQRSSALMLSRTTAFRISCAAWAPATKICYQLHSPALTLLFPWSCTTPCTTSSWHPLAAVRLPPAGIACACDSTAALLFPTRRSRTQTRCCVLVCCVAGWINDTVCCCWFSWPARCLRADYQGCDTADHVASVLDCEPGVFAVQLGGGAPACSRWRLTISRLRDPQAACAVQLAGLDLYCQPDSTAAKGPATGTSCRATIHDQMQSGNMAVGFRISRAIHRVGGQAPSQQLGGLSLRHNATGSAGKTAEAEHLTAHAAQPSTVPSSPAVPTNGASAAATAAANTALPSSSASQADARAAFHRRVQAHFSRLMAGGSVTPAAAAAQALKLAAQG